MAELNVSVVTPEREVYSGPASEVRVPGWEGEFDVLPGHDLVLALMRGGVVHIATPQGALRYIVGRGFAEVSGDLVTVLTDSCESAEDVDKAAALTELAAAEKTLGESSADTPAWDAAVERREILQARLNA